MIHDVVSYTHVRQFKIWIRIIKSGHCISETRFFQHHNLFWCVYVRPNWESNQLLIERKKGNRRAKNRLIEWIKTKAKYSIKKGMLKVSVNNFDWANLWYILVTKNSITTQDKIKFLFCSLIHWINKSAMSTFGFNVSHHRQK